MSVDGSGSVCAYEFGPVRVDEFGPTDADEDVVQEAEELEHVLAPILLSKADVEVGALCVSSGAKTFTWSSQSRHENEEAEQISTVDHCSSCEIARVKASGVTMDVMAHRRVILKSDQEPSIVVPCDAVKMVGMARMCLRHLPRTRARATEVEWCCSICARTGEDPQKVPGATIWNHFGVSKSAFGLDGRAWIQAFPLFHKGGHTACMRGELSCRVLVSALTTESVFDTSWSRGCSS